MDVETFYLVKYKQPLTEWERATFHHHFVDRERTLSTPDAVIKFLDGLDIDIEVTSIQVIYTEVQTVDRKHIEELVGKK